MYRIGYRTAGFGEAPLADVFQALGEVGCDSVELCLEHPELDPETITSVRAREILHWAASGGVRLHSVSFHGDGLPWERRSQLQARAVEVASAFGVGVVVVNTPRAEEGIEPEQVHEHLAGLARTAEANGLKVAVEPEPDLVIGDVADMLRALGACRCPALAVNVDIGHLFLTEADVPSAIRALAGVIAHVHIEDMVADEHRHLVPGEGEIDLVEAVCALWRAGYRGVLTIDLFGRMEDPVEVAGRAVRAMRDVLREALVHATRG